MAGIFQPSENVGAEPKTKIIFPPDLDEDHECFEAPEDFQPEGHLSNHPCMKNHGHVGFIPVKDLRPEDLPCDYKRQEMFEMIKAVSPLIVRIHSTYISPNRPSGYPFHQFRGKKVNCYGTGFIFPGARTSCGSEPETFVYQHPIQTAQHVIFDESEAKQATVHAYFDQEGSPPPPPAVTLIGTRGLGYFNTRADYSEFFCVTHDKDVSNSLNAAYDHFDKLFHRRKLDPPYHSIVSHPHGFHKHISFGDWQKKPTSDLDQDGFALTRLYYNTPTCPGSSGANVEVWRSGKSIIPPQLVLLRLHQGCKIGGWNHSNNRLN